MSIPTSITTALTSLELQVIAAQPLIDAPFSTITALQLNSINLVASVQSALITPNLLDTYVPSIDAPTIIKEVLILLTVAQDQQTLSLLRGVVGRADFNLAQLI